MAFTTKTFMVFMAVVFLLYYRIPTKHQWKLLLCASYVFYAFASPVYVIFLVFTTVVTYLGGRKLQDLHNRESELIAVGQLSREVKKNVEAAFEVKRKHILTIVILLLLALLAVFKYSLFILKNVSVLLGVFGVDVPAPALKLILPVGLSFYIFQSLGYCIDVKRGTCIAQENFAKYALFVSFFPQLLQGPIGNYTSLAPQLFTPHVFDYRKAVDGLQRVAWGFFKKLVVANQIEAAIGPVFSSYTDYSGLIWVVVLVLYALELYADFSGYMDIALGCGQMLGITLDENFDAPYFSSSVAEFWRRWHITLGAWFKNYLFYPLRTGKLKALRKRLKKKGRVYLSSTLPTAITLFVVWLCTGIWHGADWSYVVWGLYYGAFIILDTFLAPIWEKWREKHRAISESKAFILFRMIRTFAIVVIGDGIFAPADLAATAYIFTHWVGFLHLYEIKLLFSSSRALLSTGVGIAVLFCVDVCHVRKGREPLCGRISKMPLIMRYVVYLAGLFSIAMFGAFGRSAFIYFGF